MVVSQAPGQILIIEDDAGILELERTRLERAGFSVLTAGSAEEGMDQLRLKRVDLILLDYRLPGNVDGLEFFSRLKQSHLDVPVILVTGYGNEATLIRAIRMGVRDFVTKSTEYLDYLPDAVDRVLREIRVEKQLADSESRLAAVIRTAKDAIIVTDSARRVTLFNAAAENMFGCPAASAMGESLLRFIQPTSDTNSDKDSLGASITQRLRTGSYGIRANGATFPVETAVSRGGDESQMFYTVVVRDVTERDRAELALRRSEALFRLVWENSVDPIRLTDENGTVVLVNEAYCQLVGQPREQLEGKAFSTVHAEDRQKKIMDSYLANFAARSFPRRMEREVCLWNGRTVWLDLSNTLLDLPGAPALLLTIFRDVTARRLADERIRDQAALLDEARDAILVRDADDRIVFWNRGAERLYGWSSAEAVGRVAAELLHRGAATQLAEAHLAVLQHGEWAGELTQVAKDGREIIVESRRTLLRGPDGEPKSQLIINSDVTQRKNLEVQLRHAQRMEGIGLLAGGVAHDFNNLITIITGYSELLLSMRHSSDRDYSLLMEIRKAGERAAALTRQLLVFSRKQVLSPKVFDLSALVAETERMLRRLIGADIDLATVLESNLGNIRADPGQIEQVIINLVVNARDAMPEGGMLTLETRNVDIDEDYARLHLGVVPGPHVMLAVSDTGRGMEEAVRARIFEPFFTTKEVGKGTGLGLSTVHGIVAQSGGRIEVYSEIGCGTTFKIYFPRIGEAAASVASEPASYHAPRGTETVLLAEDEDGVRQLAVVALESSGYRVLVAENGAEALQLARDCPVAIDLLVTDLVMPQMSGRQLAQELGAIRPGLRVLFLSGYTDDAIVRHGILQADLQFLQKPFTPAVLLRKVREVLDGAKAG